MENKKISRSKALAAKLIHAMFKILVESGKEMPLRDLLKKVEEKVELDEWAKASYEKSGYVRWQSILHFFSIDCLKAGFLIKKQGVWYITPEGEEALKLIPIDMLETYFKHSRKRFCAL